MLPHEIAWMLIDFGKPEHREAVQILIKFSPILTYLHSCSNPLVYGLMISQFRSDAKKCLCCVGLEDFPECSEPHEHDNVCNTSRRNRTSPKTETKLDEDVSQHQTHPTRSTSTAVYAVDKNRVEKEPLIIEQNKQKHGIYQTKVKKNSTTSDESISQQV
jgi:hypothetical protein